MSEKHDLTGRRFGFLTVIRRDNKKAKSGSLWVCKCDCGRIVSVTRCNLKSGNSKSCGCKMAELMNETREKHGYVKDLSGRVFGKLLVLYKSVERSGTNPLWVCECQCGNTSTVIQENLLNGHTTSCGCNKFDIGSFATTHGLSATRLHAVWRGMLSRCSNPNNNNYQYYGGRGIAVCEEWRCDFKKFHDWAMSNGYDPNAPFGKCTIDRIDVDGDYEPSNCRWVDSFTQAKNKRKYKGD